jgi:hypothetical protein
MFMEGLEQRSCFSMAVQFDELTGVLQIYGTKANDMITVVLDAVGINTARVLVLSGDRFAYLESVTSVLVKSGAGKDRIDIWGDTFRKSAVTVSVDAGSGHDKIFVRGNFIFYGYGNSGNDTFNAVNVQYRAKGTNKRFYFGQTGVDKLIGGNRYDIFEQD